MYLVKIKVWDESSSRSYYVGYLVKNNSTLNTMKINNYLLKNHQKIEEVEILNEKQIFKDSNCGIFLIR